MTNTTHYHLTNARNDWWHALMTIAPLLPNDIDIYDIPKLSLLPIFALVVIIDKETLTHDPHTLIEAWADEQQLQPIAIRHSPSNDAPFIVSVNQVTETLANVQILRYWLLPKHKHAITFSNKEVILYAIDGQLTTHLRKYFKPKPTFNYELSGTGEVVNFGFQKLKSYGVDCHLLSVGQVLRPHKLACFDMDSTLIHQEVIVELANKIGIGEQMHTFTEQAMRGEMDFIQSFIKRVALLAGTPANLIDEIIPTLTLQSGAFVTIATLKALGYHTALISGGFTPFAKHIAKLLGIDHYYANTLEISDGNLTGKLIAPIIDDKQKANIVGKLADHLGLDLSEVICIGDGANDLPMMAISDIGMAFHAKPIVQVKADVALNVTGLEGVLYALGYDNLQKL